jgi:hypothetical protein
MFEIIRPAFLLGILFLGYLLDDLITRYAIWHIGASTPGNSHINQSN